MLVVVAGATVMVTQPGTYVIAYLVLDKPPGMIGYTPGALDVAPLPVNLKTPDENALAVVSLQTNWL
jgi:hypothetical protein